MLPLQLRRNQYIGERPGERLDVRARGVNRRHQRRRRERCRPAGLQRGVGVVDDCGEAIVPGQPQKIRDFGDGLRGKGGFAGGEPFEGQKHLAGRAGVAARRGQQHSVAQCLFIFVPSEQTHRGLRAVERLAGAPAAQPDGGRPHKIVQAFQGNAGGKRSVNIAGFAPAWRGPVRQLGWPDRRRRRCGGKRIHAAQHRTVVQFMPENCN